MPCHLQDGTLELGSDLMHKMLRNQSCVERCLTKMSSYENFQTWLMAVEDWVQVHADVDLDELGPRMLRTMVRATIDAALLRELDWRGAMAGRISWAWLVFTIREVLKIALHNLKISLRHASKVIRVHVNLCWTSKN